MNQRWIVDSGLKMLSIEFDPKIPKNFQRKNYQQRWLEDSGKWLKNVAQTHLVLVSGKLVLPKNKVEVV